MTEITLREYIDAQDEKTRAQNDARFAEVIARLEQMPRFWPLVVAGIAGLAGSIGLVFAVLAYAGDRFDGGISVSGVVNQLQEIQSQRDNEQDMRIGRILEALEQINLERSPNSAD